MAARGVIHFALDQEKLPVGGSGSGGGIIYLIEREFLREAKIDERDQRFFILHLQDMFRRKRNQRRVVVAAQSDRFSDGTFGENGIGIGEQQPALARMLCAERHRVVFSDPTGWRGSGVDDAKLREIMRQIAQRLRCSIRRLVVYHDDLRNFGLGAERPDAGGNHVFFVAGRDNRTDRSGMIHGLWIGERIDSQVDRLV